MIRGMSCLIFDAGLATNALFDRLRAAFWATARSLSRARAVRALALRAWVVVRWLRLTRLCGNSTLVSFDNPASSFGYTGDIVGASVSD
jgi:hypothetical protein